MRVGVITTATDRGLGTQTWEAARHLDAEVLIVDQRDPRFPAHIDRHPGAPVVRTAGGLHHPDTVRGWLATVDAVYSAETLFDKRLPVWADAAGVTTVLHANPEFWTNTERPHRLWSATPWRKDAMPDHTEIVPFPVATDRFTPATPHDGPCRWLHVAGKRALADRNGTDTVVAALPLLKEECEVRLVVQHGDLPDLPDLPPHVTVTVVPSPADYWRLYDDSDALVLPRRYGGLCLPAQEAMAAGLAVLMTEVGPNEVWPGPRVKVGYLGKERMPAGRVPVYGSTPAHLAREMDKLADPGLRHGWQRLSREWATAHSWDVMAPRWLDLMATEVAA